MTGRFKRRQRFVHPVQYRLMATVVMYFSCVVIVLYGVVFLPMAQPLFDPSASWQEHAQVATDFLDLNARIWPWLAVTFLALLLHSTYFMHRVAGPLFRFKVLFRSIGTGQLHRRARLREHDYLHEEAEDFNAMLDSLEEKIDVLRRQTEVVTQAYEDVARQLNGRSPGQVNDAFRTLGQELLWLKLRLHEFAPHDPDQPTDQQRLNFSGAPPHPQSSTLKAA